MATFGIHLGNSSVCLAVNKDGKTDVMANDSGDRVTPAVIAFNDSERLVGLAAKMGLARNGPATVINNKRFLNNDLNDEELEASMLSSLCKIRRENDSIYYELVDKDGETLKKVTPDEVVLWLYKNMYSIASNSTGEVELGTVLAVPSHFSQSSRKRVALAAQEAGFNVLQVISEPAAAVLAYGLGEGDISEDYHVLVYRLGGTSTDVSVVRVSGGLYSVSSTIHCPDLGGKTFTQVLADYIAAEFAQKWKLDPSESRRSMSKLFQHAENCKRVLSTLASSHVFVESLLDGVDWSQNVSRARFENLISPKLATYVEPINQALAKANITGNISKVILCGGSMNIPKLQSTIAAMFPDAEVLKRISPDEVIAEGCARQAALLAQPWDVDCNHLKIEAESLSKAIFAKFEGIEGEKCLFPEACAVPTRHVFGYTLPKGQNAMNVTVFEKDLNGEEDIILGTFLFTGLATSVLEFIALVEPEGLSLRLAETAKSC